MFEHVMHPMLCSVKRQFAFVYLHDIVYFSRWQSEHMNHTRLVYSLLKEAAATLILKKYVLFTDNLVYLGHVIRPGRFEVASHSTNAIPNVKISTSQTELRSFMYLCTVFRHSLRNMARIVSLLTE